MNELIKKAKEIEDDIQKEENKFKQLNLKSPNESLKDIIVEMEKLTKNLVGKDDEEGKLLDEIKNDIESFKKDSENEEFYKKWNFDAPIIKESDLQYSFKLLENTLIKLNDKNEGKKEIIELKEEDVDEILKIMKEKLEKLSLSKKIEALLNIRELTKKLLKNKNDVNSEQISKDDFDRLIKSLDNFDNINTFLSIINTYRAETHQLDENLFNALVEIFQKLADFFLKSKDYQFASLFMTISKTFFYSDNNEKIYICQKIKGHDLFKDMSFLESAMTKEINIQKETFNLDKYKGENGEYDYQRLTGKLNEKINNVFLTFTVDIDAFGIPKENMINSMKKVIINYPDVIQESAIKNISNILNN